MSEGWIKLHRKFKNWEWYSDVPTKVLFLHLLLHVNHTNKRWKGVKIARGEMLASRDSLARDTGLSRQQIRTAQNKLKSTSELTIKSTSQYSLYCLTNYDLYQGKQPAHQPASNQRATTTKNEKNEKNIKMGGVITLREYIEMEFKKECGDKNITPKDYEEFVPQPLYDAYYQNASPPHQLNFVWKEFVLFWLDQDETKTIQSWKGSWIKQINYNNKEEE